jgi:ABC-type multidrug transport system fused ATPase/permease subunit
VHHAVTFIAGLAVGFATSWKLTLVIMACVPMLVFLIVFLKNSITSAEKESTDAYARAGDAATEAFALIRTVQAYGGERATVRLERERVLVGARDLPLRGHALGGQAHAVGDAEVLVALEGMGVARVFTPGTPTSEIVAWARGELEKESRD